MPTSSPTKRELSIIDQLKLIKWLYPDQYEELIKEINKLEKTNGK